MSGGAKSPEVAVVGAGIVGLATALSLRESGVEVRCFERGHPGCAQSAGETRLFRHRHEDERLIRLAVAARRGWSEWEGRGSVELLGREGVLRFGDDVASAQARLRRAGVDAELLSPPEQAEVLPGLVSPQAVALLETGAGGIRARRAIELLAGWLGGALVAAEVLGIERLGSGFRLRTSSGPCECERLVLCAGIRTPALARAVGVEIAIALRCHPRASFRTRDRSRRLAGLQDGSGEHGELVYGAPCPDGERYVVGLVGPDADARCDRTGVLASDLTPLVGRVRGYVERALGSLVPEVASLRLCHTTKLGEDKDAFAVWSTDGAVAVAGNNLFKFAPALGATLAEAVVNGEVPDSVPRGGETALAAGAVSA